MVLADFGFACENSEEFVGGTTGFIAPEVRQTFRITPKADIWSAGISFAILVNLISILFTIKLGVVDYTDKVMKTSDFVNMVIQRTYDFRAKHLLSQLLSLDSEQRLTAGEVLNHSYFSGFIYYHLPN